MKAKQSALQFFLGANTPQGFVSRFDQLTNAKDGWRTLIIKGGPGSGKSTLMKRVYDAFSDRYDDMELIYCSSDVGSLDAVIIPQLKVDIADGTSPHVIEPKYPGAVESIVNVSACWDDDKLAVNRDAIIALGNACSTRHEHCCRFLNATAILSNDTYRIALDCLKKEKLVSYLDRLAEREFKQKKGSAGIEKIRLLSAVTNKGVQTFIDSAKRLCGKLYLISDDYGAVSRMMLHKLRSKALAAGYDVVTSYCPLGPYDKIEHLLIPSLNLGFVTSNRMHDFSLQVDPYRIVNSKRFMDAEVLKKSKRRIAFNRKSEQQMITQAEQLLAEAKSLHDELENYYVAAMDFDAVEKLTAEVIEKIEQMAK